jgi:hypothetical protein
VLSAINTLRVVSCDSQVGSTRRGLAAILSSSSTMQDARAGGNAGNMLHEMSRAKSVLVILGKADVRNPGIWFGVEEPERSRCVVPINDIIGVLPTRDIASDAHLAG